MYQGGQGSAGYTSTPALRHWKLIKRAKVVIPGCGKERSSGGRMTRMTRMAQNDQFVDLARYPCANALRITLLLTFAQSGDPVIPCLSEGILSRG